MHCVTQAASTSSSHGARTPDIVSTQLVGSRSLAPLEAPSSSRASAPQEAPPTLDPEMCQLPSPRAEESRGDARTPAAGDTGGVAAEQAPAEQVGAPRRACAGTAQEAPETPYMDLCDLPWPGDMADRARGGSGGAPAEEARAHSQELQESAQGAAVRREGRVARLEARRSSSLGVAERGAERARSVLSRKSRSLGAARGPNPFAEIRDRVRPRCAGTA